MIAHEASRQGHDLIDCDVHERFVSQQELVPYLADKWKANITDRGWNMERRVPYTQMSVAGLDRADARPMRGGPGGSDYQLMRDQLLDRYSVRYGVLTGLFYPSIMRAWYDFATALCSAYNDWLIDQWLRKDERLLGSIHVAAQDPESAAREIDRVGNHPQMVQVMLPVVDFMTYGEKRFHPIFQSAERHGLAIAMHVSPSTVTSNGFMQYFIEWHTALSQAYMTQLISVVANGVFEKYPSLKLVLVEGGFTWVPSLMWRFDQQYRQLRLEVPWLNRFPSDYMREHVRFTTQPVEELDTNTLLQVIDQMGSDEMLLFSSDYPHWDFDSPAAAFSGLDASLRNKIYGTNAVDTYGSKIGTIQTKAQTNTT